MMQKAKSRFSKNTINRNREENYSHIKPKMKPVGLNGKSEYGLKYLKYLPLLIVSVLLYSSIAWLVAHIEPGELQNTLFPNSYLPFAVLLFFANLLFFSYIFLNTRRGFLAASFIGILLFFKLQKIVFEAFWLLPLLGLLMLFELTVTKIKNKFSQ